MRQRINRHDFTVLGAFVGFFSWPENMEGSDIVKFTFAICHVFSKVFLWQVPCFIIWTFLPFCALRLRLIFAHFPSRSFSCCCRCGHGGGGGLSFRTFSGGRCGPADVAICGICGISRVPCPLAEPGKIYGRWAFAKLGFIFQRCSHHSNHLRSIPSQSFGQLVLLRVIVTGSTLLVQSKLATGQVEHQRQSPYDPLENRGS